MLVRDPKMIEAEARKRAMQGKVREMGPRQPKVPPSAASLAPVGTKPTAGAGAVAGATPGGPVRLPGAPAPTQPKPAAPGIGAPPGSGGSVGGAAPAKQPVSQADIDQMIRDRVQRELEGGPRSTAEDEALVQQRMDEAIGSGAVNARARAGRGGFQASGALMGIEGDLERQARTAAAEQALGVRKDAREEQFGREGDVIRSELDMRRAAADDEINKRLLELLGMDEGAPAEGGGGGADAVVNPIMDAVGAEREAPEMPNAGRQSGAGSVNDPIIVASPPPGAQRRGTDAQGREMWFTVDDKGVYTHYRIGG